MNIPVVTTTLICLGALPFTAGVLAATWRQRRAMARRSRDLTIEIGPKVLLGVALTGVAATPALAAPTPVGSSAAPAWLPVLDRGPMRTAPVVAPAPSTHPSAAPTKHPVLNAPGRGGANGQRAGNGSHVVRTGESLWSITAHYLGPKAQVSDIAAAWPRLFESNRTVIGSNPRLVLPGQRLALPSEFDQVGP